MITAVTLRAVVHDSQMRRCAGTGTRRHTDGPANVPAHGIRTIVEDDPVIRAGSSRSLIRARVRGAQLLPGFEALRQVTQGPPTPWCSTSACPTWTGSTCCGCSGHLPVPVLVATARDDDAGSSGSSTPEPTTTWSSLSRAASSPPGSTPCCAVRRRGPQAPRRPRRSCRRAAGRPAGPRPPRPTAARALPDPARVRPARLPRRARRPGRIPPRILAEVWQQPYVEDQTIDVHLSALRRKLGERAAHPATCTLCAVSGSSSSPPVMRRALAGISLAATLMVALSFLIPLALLVRRTGPGPGDHVAEQRAAALARRSSPSPPAPTMSSRRYSGLGRGRPARRPPARTAARGHDPCAARRRWSARRASARRWPSTPRAAGSTCQPVDPGPGTGSRSSRRSSPAEDLNRGRRGLVGA